MTPHPTRRAVLAAPLLLAPDIRQDNGPGPPSWPTEAEQEAMYRDCAAVAVADSGGAAIPRGTAARLARHAARLASAHDGHDRAIPDEAPTALATAVVKLLRAARTGPGGRP